MLDGANTLEIQHISLVNETPTPYKGTSFCSYQGEYLVSFVVLENTRQSSHMRGTRFSQALWGTKIY